MTPLDVFEEKINAYIGIMQAAGLADMARGLQLACAVAAPIIEELQAAAPKKQRGRMNLSPEERQRRAERLRAYHAKRRENRA